MKRGVVAAGLEAGAAEAPSSNCLELAADGAAGAAAGEACAAPVPKRQRLARRGSGRSWAGEGAAPAPSEEPASPADAADPPAAWLDLLVEAADMALDGAPGAPARAVPRQRAPRAPPTSARAASPHPRGLGESPRQRAPKAAGAKPTSTQQWTAEEDALLNELVTSHGTRKWSFIAAQMTQRLCARRGKQCRDRWVNHLRPDIRRGEWTEEEERILVDGHMRLGPRWAALAQLLNGRPENAIKNHWHATLRCKSSRRRGQLSVLKEYQQHLATAESPAAAAALALGSASAAKIAKTPAAAPPTPARSAAEFAPMATAASLAVAQTLALAREGGAAAAAAAAATTPAAAPRRNADTTASAASSLATRQQPRRAAAVAAAAVAATAAGDEDDDEEAMMEDAAGAGVDDETAAFLAAMAMASKQAGPAVMAAAAAAAVMTAVHARQNAEEGMEEADAEEMMTELAETTVLAKPPHVSQQPTPQVSQPAALSDQQSDREVLKENASPAPGAAHNHHEVTSSALDIVEVRDSPIHGHKYVSAVRGVNGGSEVATYTSTFSLEESSSGSGEEEEELEVGGGAASAAEVRDICAAIRKQHAGIGRIAVGLRAAGSGGRAGDLRLVIAISAKQWRAAMEAVQHATRELHAAIGIGAAAKRTVVAPSATPLPQNHFQPTVLDTC